MLANPITAIRAISHDITGRTLIPLADGRSMSALDLQLEFLRLAGDWLSGSDESENPAHLWTLELWDRALRAVETGNLALVETEIDWVIKYRLLTRYVEAQGLDWSSPRIAQLDLAFHDINPRRGIFPVLERRGLAKRLVGEDDIRRAMISPPSTTRAKVRGDFISAAAACHREVTVDWSSMRVTDLPQQVVHCPDPFASSDARVERLIAELHETPG